MQIIGSDAVVTGGAGGIGRGLMRRLIQDGVHKIACVDRIESSAEKFALELNRELDRDAVVPYCGDAQDHEFIWAVMQNFTALCGGPPEILVSLMGMPLDALMESYKVGKPPKTFAMQRLIDNLRVNAAAPAEWACAFAYLHDKARTDRGFGNWSDQGGAEEGVVVFTGSVSAEIGIVGQLGYGMAKNALIGALRVFRTECYLRLGLRPVLINPGFIETPMVMEMDRATQDAVLANIPSRRFLTVEEIVETFIYSIKCDSISDTISVGNGYSCPSRMYRDEPKTAAA